MSTRAKKRADRIRERCEIGVILQRYGYNVIPDDHREQQYACDLHGIDNKPSARYYPRTNSVYCFACGKSRDPINLVMDKEGVGFREACDSLERQFNLAPLPWEDEGDEDDEPTTADELDAIIAAGVPFEREAKRISRLLDTIAADHDLDMKSTFMFVEAFDRVTYGVLKEGLSEVNGKAALAKLHAKIMAKIREKHAGKVQ